jgi:hypothetical protein
MPIPAQNETALYRHFDKDGRLLYVGISLSAVVRMQQHIRQAKWARDIARIEVEWFETRCEAEAAEWRAIRTEGPIHNQTHNKMKPAPIDAIVVLGVDGKAIANLAVPPISQAVKEHLASQRRINVEARSRIVRQSLI